MKTAEDLPKTPGSTVPQNVKRVFSAILLISLKAKNGKGLLLPFRCLRKEEGEKGKGDFLETDFAFVLP